MSDRSAIEWTDASWNVVTGCDRVSPGCAHCYALDLAARLKTMGQARYQRDGGKSSGPGFAVTLHPDKLDEPLRWRKPRMVFVNSMSDLFHEGIPENYIQRVFAVMALARQHTFQVLTKRPERMLEIVAKLYDHPMREHYATDHRPYAYTGERHAGPALRPGIFDPYYGMANWQWIEEGPLPNVWLGVSIENRRFVHRADLLRETPAAVRFISAEPLLGPLLPERYLVEDGGEPMWFDDYKGDGLDLTAIDWLIVGGESGPKHRRFDLRWARDLRDSAQTVGTAVFVKQLGGARPGTKLEDLPEDLRIREFPRALERVA